MTRNFVAAIFFFICGVGTAHAEGGCPPGQYPQQGQGWQTCVPIPGGNAENQASQPISVPSGWRSQWQAIATDTSKGIMGTSMDIDTPEGSVSAALADCRKKGGVNCQTEIAYGNGCVALVFGNKLMNSKGDVNLKTAEKRAMDKCNEEDTNCHVYYSACSLPIEVPL